LYCLKKKTFYKIILRNVRIYKNGSSDKKKVLRSTNDVQYKNWYLTVLLKNTIGYILKTKI